VTKVKVTKISWTQFLWKLFIQVETLTASRMKSQV